MRQSRKPKKKKLATVFRSCLLALVGIVAGVNIYLWNANNLGGNAMPTPFGYGCAVVLSGSMEPTLKPDDLIFVRVQDEYEVGDVVVYQDGKHLTVHRLIALDGDRAVTKGDANNVADDPIGAERIIGRLCGRIPRVGLVARAMKTPLGIAVLLGAALLLAEFSYRNERRSGDETVEKLKEEIRRLREEQQKE